MRPVVSSLVVFAMAFGMQVPAHALSTGDAPGTLDCNGVHEESAGLPDSGGGSVADGAAGTTEWTGSTDASGRLCTKYEGSTPTP